VSGAGTRRQDAGTLFGIASNTKVFTAPAGAERARSSDAPVINYLPWFQMYDSG
jgi:CubicO group peptidase (beta-lactamase class C family)